jgi:hypothetical protein
MFLLTDTTKTRARSLSGVSAGLSAAIFLAVYFGIGDHDTTLILPVLASMVAVLWPTRIVVGVAMLVTAAVFVLGFEDSGVLFGASVAMLMLALNTLQATATRIRRRPRRASPPADPGVPARA